MLSELLGTLPLGDIGYAAIVVIVVLMILTDRLVTRRRLEEAREDGAGWRTAFEKQQEVNGVQAAGLSELLTLARSSDHALRSIQSMGAAVFAATTAQEEKP